MSTQPFDQTGLTGFEFSCSHLSCFDYFAKMYPIFLAWLRCLSFFSLTHRHFSDVCSFLGYSHINLQLKYHQQWALYLGSYIHHTCYRVNLPHLQIELFPSLLKEGGTEVFSWEKSFPCHNFFAGLPHTVWKKAPRCLWRYQMNVLTVMVVYS